MKRFTQVTIGLLLAVAILGVGFFSVVSADDGTVSDQQIQKIKDNCLSTKNTLGQLHSSDALLRVNMGQSYESMSTKLMVRFNNRLGNNNIANANLVNVSGGYNTVLDTFRLDYISYEEQLTMAMNIDCQKEPVSFYDAVSNARNKRELVHTDIQRLNQLLDQYQTEFSAFQKEYKAASEGVKRQ